MTLRSRVSEAVETLRASGAVLRPAVGIVLGSGLGALADEVDAEAAVPYSQIPHCPVPTAAGHQGHQCSGKPKREKHRNRNSLTAPLVGMPRLHGLANNVFHGLCAGVHGTRHWEKLMGIVLFLARTGDS